MKAVLWMVCGLAFLQSLVFADNAESLLIDKLSAMQTMRADFTQTVHAKHRLIAQSSGNMVLARPNRFRWQTKTPMPQLVIADGKTIWIYDPELEQVTVSQQTKHTGGAAALFLSQSIEGVRQHFSVAIKREGKQDIFVLQAKSPKSQFDTLRLRFHADRLQSMTLDDQLGQHTVIRLSNVSINQPASPRLFRFRIPAGVDVVRQ